MRRPPCALRIDNQSNKPDTTTNIIGGSAYPLHTVAQKATAAFPVSQVRGEQRGAKTSLPLLKSRPNCLMMEVLVSTAVLGTYPGMRGGRQMTQLPGGFQRGRAEHSRPVNGKNQPSVCFRSTNKLALFVNLGEQKLQVP
ncbi:hypothetical protein BaRGS_00015246 [Batillaria attramentaria]|uniref:Uncharacterized protein n=1 Tax=Batillaria attramentaria TaxID=370345 RepID=A0ABD0L239_9CAEN